MKGDGVAGFRPPSGALGPQVIPGMWRLSLKRGTMTVHGGPLEARFSNLISACLLRLGQGAVEPSNHPFQLPGSPRFVSGQPP